MLWRHRPARSARFSRDNPTSTRAAWSCEPESRIIVMKKIVRALAIAHNVNNFHQAAGGGLGCAHPSIRGRGKWTPREHAALSSSPPCRCSAQPSPGLWITPFSARSLPRSVPSPFSAPQPRGTGADMGKLVLKRASVSRPSGQWTRRKLHL
jgi:hypothetical protein